MDSEKKQAEQKAEKKREEVLAYLEYCVTENLNHARHVENERLTFTSIYVAMVLGAVAVVFGLDERWIAILLSFLLALFGLLSLLLNMRWQGVFDDHIHMAEDCQKRWRDGVDKGVCPQLPDMGYYYANYHKTSGLGNALRRLIGDSVWDLNLPVKAREKAREKRKKANDTLMKKIGWVFKELGRTRRQFALLYLVIFLGLIGLVVYLYLNKEYGGFYFSDEVITKLEEALTRIVEETKQ